MIAARVAGTDGLGKAKFTIATLQKMWESDKLPLALDVLKPLVSACDATPTATDGTTVDLTDACAALTDLESANGAAGTLGAKGAWLFTVWAHLDTDSNATGQVDNFYATQFNPKKPLTTPTGLNTSGATPLTFLADAVQNLQAHNVTLDASAAGKWVTLPYSAWQLTAAHPYEAITLTMREKRGTWGLRAPRPLPNVSSVALGGQKAAIYPAF